MARRIANLMSIGLMGIAAVACGRAEEPGLSAAEPAAKAAAPVGPAPGATIPLYRQADCPAGPSGRPSPGEVFDYRMLTDAGGLDRSALRRQTVKAVSGDVVDYDEMLEMTGQGAFPAEARGVRLVILPTQILGASVRYEGANDAMTALEPGQTVTIPAAYSRGRSTLQGQAKVTLIECGVSAAAITGAAGEPVVVYRLVMPYSTTLNPDELSETLDNEYVVSHARGWPIAERTSSGTLVLIPRTE